MQQINLYQPVFGEQRKPLSAGQFAIVFGATLAGLIAYSIHTDTQAGALQQAVETLRAQQAEHEARLAESGELAATRDQPSTIDTRLKALERTLTERRTALEILQSGAAGQPLGFASRMEALARRHVEGLWIDQLVLSGTNGSMSLSGATLDADIVPAYLNSLARERVLSGTRFDEFIIERPTASSVAPSDGESVEGAPRQRASSPQHIRFRAGNKALTAAPSGAEAAT